MRTGNDAAMTDQPKHDPEKWTIVWGDDADYYAAKVFVNASHTAVKVEARGGLTTVLPLVKVAALAASVGPPNVLALEERAIRFAERNNLRSIGTGEGRLETIRSLVPYLIEFAAEELHRGLPSPPPQEPTP